MSEATGEQVSWAERLAQAVAAHAAAMAVIRDQHAEEVANLIREHAAEVQAHDAIHEVEAAQLSDQFSAALASRDLIGQAKGLLMATRGCTADEAFQILRIASQQLNLKLVVVASNIVDAHLFGLRRGANGE